MLRLGVCLSFRKIKVVWLEDGMEHNGWGGGMGMAGGRKNVKERWM